MRLSKSAPLPFFAAFSLSFGSFLLVPPSAAACCDPATFWVAGGRVSPLPFRVGAVGFARPLRGPLLPPAACDGVALPCEPLAFPDGRAPLRQFSGINQLGSTGAFFGRPLSSRS